ncbi:MAG: hypothetical protein AAGE13_05520 [Pseudomonadota bacterium]
MPIAHGAEPLSAIPWLSDALRAAQPAPDRTRGVEIARLEDVRPLGPGLLSAADAGLPEDLWAQASALRVRRLIEQVRGTGVVAARDLFRRLMITQLMVPRGSADASGVLLARSERLVALGALEEAQALLAASGLTRIEALRRSFDIALLTGQDQQACVDLLSHPGVAPTDAARIFCLAQRQEWRQAVLSLAVAREARTLSPAMAELLSRYLEVTETAPEDRIALPQPVSPLVYRMLLAIGAGGAGTVDAGLPLAYAHLDLTSTAPPRARMLAAERLVASGGAPFPLLFAAYRAETPAASGGVWSRSATIQKLDAALASEKRADIRAALARADRMLTPLGLRVALAREYAPALAKLRPNAGGDARVAALLLLGDRVREASAWLSPAPDPQNRAVHAASAALSGAPVPLTGGRFARAVAAAFSAQALQDPPQTLALILQDSRRGEALLIALRLLDAGPQIDPGDLTEALVVLRWLGLERCARRIAAQTLLAARAE